MGRQAFLGVVFLLLFSSAVLGQPVNEQRSQNGDVVMQVVYDKPVVVRNDGVNRHFGHRFENNGVGDWTMVTCPLPSVNELPPPAWNALRNVPVFSEKGNPNVPDFVDMSGGCLRFDFSAKNGDRFRIGASSTVVEILNGSAEFVVTPEYQTCQYLVCESFIEVHNLESESISFPASSLFAKAENQRNLSVFSVNLGVPVEVVDGTFVNESLTSFEVIEKDMVVERNVVFNDSLTIPSEGVGRFRIVSEFAEEKEEFKYNVSLLYNGQTFLIDPFYVTREGNFSAGTFDTTFLNPNGYVELVPSFLNGTYYSEIFDTRGNSNITNMSWYQEVAYEYPFPDFYGNETITDVVTPVNLSGLVALFHFDNTSSENSTFVRDFASGVYNLSCVDCPVFYNDSVFGKSVYFDGSDDYYTISNTSIGNVGNQSFSVGFWINSTDSGNDYVVSKRTNGDGWSIGVRSTKLVRFTIDEVGSPSISVESVREVTDGQWHHVVAVRDTENAVIRIYVDGVERAIPVNDGAVLSLNNSLHLAVGASSSGNNLLDGQVDEATAWNRALSADEVRLHYLRGLSLRPYVRSCDDQFCFNDNLIEVDGSSIAVLNISDNERYFQYAFNFSSRYGGYSPRVYNVTVGYEVSELQGGLVLLECPQGFSNWLLLYGVVALCGFLIFFSFMTGNPMFGLIGSLMIMITSFFIVDCTNVIGGIMLFGGVLLLWYFGKSFSGSRGVYQ